MAADRAHDSTPVVDDGRAAIDSLWESLCAIPGGDASQISERRHIAVLSLRHLAQAGPVRHASFFLLDCVCLYEHRLAYAADVSTRTQLSNMARSRTLMLSHDRAALLVTRHPTLPPGAPNAALDHDSVPFSRRFSEHCARGILYVLRARALSGLRDSSTPQRYDCPGRPGGCRCDYVGGWFDLFPDTSWPNHDRSVEHEANSASPQASCPWAIAVKRTQRKTSGKAKSQTSRIGRLAFTAAHWFDSALAPLSSVCSSCHVSAGDHSRCRRIVWTADGPDEFGGGVALGALGRPVRDCFTADR